MLIRPKKVRKSSKFTPKWVATARRKKEQTVSLYSTAAIEFVLFFFLIIGGYKSYQAIEAQGTTLGTVEKWAVPGFFVIAGILVLRAGIRNILEARAIRRSEPSNQDL